MIGRGGIACGNTALSRRGEETHNEIVITAEPHDASD
jgi:hypothetical protein